MSDEVREQAAEPNAAVFEYIDVLAARAKGIVALTLPFAQEALFAIRSMRAGSQQNTPNPQPDEGSAAIGVSLAAAVGLVRQRPLIILGVAAACALGAYAVANRRVTRGLSK